MRALVTGAANGLGRCLTDALLRQGYHVVAVDRDVKPFDNMPPDSRNSCTVRFADLARIDSLHDLLASLEGMKFNLVVLNAGISATGNFEDIPAAAYDNLIAVNMQAPLFLGSSLLGRQLMADNSSLVFISSLSHAVGYPGASVYAATKDAVAVYARCAAKPFRWQGVRVSTIFPGPIRTEHARLHAPQGADSSKRMEPDKMAALILDAARTGTARCHPGATARMAALFGKIAPSTATRLMRKLIFEKLNGPVY